MGDIIKAEKRSGPATGKSWCCRATLLLVMLLPAKQVRGAVLEGVLKKWTQYRLECMDRLDKERPLANGVYCNGVFDQFACWPFSPPGNVSVACPWYLPLRDDGNTGYAHRLCTDNGTWQWDANRSEFWRDVTECSAKINSIPYKETALMSLLRICYTIGYSISLGTLVVALCILLTFRKLHCMRNYIHINLFASFIMRAMAVLVKDIVENTSLMVPSPTDEDGWRSKINATSSCRVVYICLHYFVGANYFWLLVEGIYLYTTIVTVLLSERRMLLRYIAIGWMCPLLFIIPWVIVRSYLENDGCWETTTNTGIWYIIKGPMLFCVFINFMVYIRILHLLHMKLKAQQLKFTDYKYRFAKATLILIPLLGTHEVFFTFVSDEHIKGLTKHILRFIQLTLSSFQGFVVAYLYCFTNGEVKTELRKQWNLFLLQYFPCRSCVFRSQVKYKPKAAKNSNNAFLTHNGVYPNAKKKSKVQLLPAPSNLTSDLHPNHSATPQYFRRSVSESSDGGLTLGETFEETVEESEIC
ncbi:glucagon-like peptide 2 receptor [Rana temporaria]|uniref:glucagon-like peptide 2 receptor n=1 Tax=Rana temporaria TaxID=8407 RepID=UPI001AAC9706|nr:glucagon-like peptide 2 receptor [Rana temporaria]